jgi:hypothetical protein
MYVKQRKHPLMRLNALCHPLKVAGVFCVIYPLASMTTGPRHGSQQPTFLYVTSYDPAEFAPSSWQPPTPAAVLQAVLY